MLSFSAVICATMLTAKPASQVSKTQVKRPVVAAAVVVAGTEQGFQLKLPAGFEVHAAGIQGDVTHAYVRGAGTETFELVQVQRLRGKIGKECAPADKVPKGVLQFKESWKGHSLCGMRMVVTEQGNPIVTLMVEVPLKREAIHLYVAGFQSREETLKVLLKDVLKELSGESNWD